ncbi:MAG: type I-D CRISPR-associated protein Cas10d/Csc3 [Anaerolineales bacterium]|nr:type I-D CRISPR-associated protein Cas10d/Csc3 [Anaerolineales bacterium]
MTKPFSFTTEDIPPDEMDESLLDDLYEEDDKEPSSETISLAEEPLFSALLRQAVHKTAPDDLVLHDYVTHVAPQLSEHLALKTAKGGTFVQERLAEGKTAVEVARYRHDQSLRAHLVNGLLPVTNIARLLTQWEAPRFRYWQEETYRLFCAGFTLHDWVKLPDVDAELTSYGLGHDSANPAKHLPVFETVFKQWCERLGLTQFLEPIGGLDFYLHDLIYLAVNTQRKWGTMLNLNALPGLRLNGRSRQLATDCCTLADLLAYVAKTPVQVASHHTIYDLIQNLSGGQARFMYHHVSENRGVLTNFIHNAAMTALQNDDCVPLLFAPSGTVYLTRIQNKTFPETAVIAETTVQLIRRACQQRLQRDFVGFSRAGKGLKVAPYYDLHLSIPDQIRLTGQAVFKQIPETKKTVFTSRYEKIEAKGWLTQPIGLGELNKDDSRVDQLAEFAAFATTLAKTAVPAFDANQQLLTQMEISACQPTFEALLNAPNTGGTPYHWYYAAGYYTLHNGRGKDPAQWRDTIATIAESLATAVETEQAKLEQPDTSDGWDDLRHYIQSTLSFGPATAVTSTIAKLTAQELARYQNAKQKGRKATAVCSLCSSSFSITPQREAGILFAPQVYTNKQPLHGSKAIRNICQICETEMMLRQILMNRGGSTGGRFEGRKFRYIYLYPTYFFTPETLAQVNELYGRLQRISFTNLRRLLLNKDETELCLDAHTIQRLQELMLSPEPPEDDRLFRFPAGTPLTFFFIGMPPPSRDAKDAEAWINPAWLSLILPLALDVKVVATESPLPLLNEADELDETVFYDAPHPFVSDLIGQERISLDGLLPRLQALTAAYMVHIDGNAKLKQGEYRWHAIPPLARNLHSNSLWATYYLKKWQRSEGMDTIPSNRAHLYQQYIQILDHLKLLQKGVKNLDEVYSLQGGINMSHARQLTELYRQFYRHKRRNSNSILRPITVASRAMLDADPRLFEDREALTEVVYGAIFSFMDRVLNGSADGRLSPRLEGEEPIAAMQRRNEAMKSFANYFVTDIYFDALGGDTAALRGKQLNLLKNTCEVIYLDAEATYWRERNTTPEDESENN